jgi:hypothetical protein
MTSAPRDEIVLKRPLRFSFLFENDLRADVFRILFGSTKTAIHPSGRCPRMLLPDHANLRSLRDEMRLL